MKRLLAVSIVAVLVLAASASTLSAQTILAPKAPVNGWSLAKVQGTNPLEASTWLMPGDSPDKNCAQVFYYSLGNGPPPILIFEKRLPRAIPRPYAVRYQMSSKHLGTNPGNYIKHRVELGRGDSIYLTGSGLWSHMTPQNSGWEELGWTTELVAVDSIDRVQFWFTAAVGSDTFEVHLATLEAVLDDHFPTDSSFVIDGFGNPLPPIQVGPAGDALDDHGVRFQWKPSEGATRYRVQIARTPYFNDVAVDDSTLTDTSKAIQGLVAFDWEYWWRVRARNTLGWSAWSDKVQFRITTVGDVQEIPTGIPSELRLDQNYPNPFNPTTLIRFAVPQSAHVTLRVFSPLGQEVATLVDERLAPGTYEADWNASRHASGAYFYELRADDTRIVRRMLLVR
jgi:hypothetical protein